MKKSLFPALTLMSMLLLFSCSKDSGSDGGNNGGGNNNGTAGPLFTSARSVIQTNCAVAGCHTGANPQNGINFSQDATIVEQKARIKVRAVDNAGTPSQMPPPPRQPLSAEDQKKITDWISAGGNTIN